MNKRKIVLISSIVVIIIVILLVCIKSSNKSGENVEKETIKNQNTVSTEISTRENTELYTSTKGYELKYNPDNFSISYENNTERFIHKTEDVYMDISIIPAIEAEVKKNTIKDSIGMHGECTFSEGTLNGFYVELESDEENKIKRNFIFDLPDKSILMIETKLYESTEKNKNANEEINKMIDTIKFKQ